MSQLTLLLIIVGLISVYMLLQSSGRIEASDRRAPRDADEKEMEAKLERMARRLENLETLLAEKNARKY